MIFLSQGKAFCYSCYRCYVSIRVFSTGRKGVRKRRYFIYNIYIIYKVINYNIEKSDFSLSPTLPPILILIET